MDTSLDSIVVAVGAQRDDDAEDLIETTLQVAVPTGATVVLAHVFGEEGFEDAVDRLDIPDASLEDADAVLARHQTVREFTTALDEHGVAYDVHGAVGDVTDELVALSEDVAADRMVITGHRRSPTGKAVFGSLSQELLLEVPCPVTYVKSE